METINITAYADNPTQVDAIKAFMKALKIKFEVSKEEKSPYNPEFVAKIKKGQQDIAEGKGVKITLDELKALCK
jgi:hypothetical protein